MNDRRILILEVLLLAMLGEVRFRSCEAAEYLKREVCRLMLRMHSPSTLSESLRPRHVRSPCESDAKSYGCDIFHLCTGVICYSVSTAPAYTSAGPLRLKQNGVSRSCA